MTREEYDNLLNGIRGKRRVSYKGWTAHDEKGLAIICGYEGFDPSESEAPTPEAPKSSRSGLTDEEKAAKADAKAEAKAKAKAKRDGFVQAKKDAEAELASATDDAAKVAAQAKIDDAVAELKLLAGK